MLRRSRVRYIDSVMKMNPCFVSPFYYTVNIPIVSSGYGIFFFPDDRRIRIIFQCKKRAEWAFPRKFCLKHLPTDIFCSVFSEIERFLCFSICKKNLSCLQIGNIHKGIHPIQYIHQSMRHDLRLRRKNVPFSSKSRHGHGRRARGIQPSWRRAKRFPRGGETNIQEKERFQKKGLNASVKKTIIPSGNNALCIFPAAHQKEPSWNDTRRSVAANPGPCWNGFVIFQ